MSPTHPDRTLSGQTCVVTGASSGIGKAAALGLARLGANVVLACRNAGRGAAARDEIASATQAKVEFATVDLSDQGSIRGFAEALLTGHGKLEVLVNNAGGWHHERSASADGIELTWATNVLGYFLLTELLLDRLRESAPARIVNVASNMAGKLDLEDVEFHRRPYRGLSAYSQSKQANQMLTFALARRIEGTGITVNAVHPGGVRTGIYRKGGGLVATLSSGLIGLFGRSPERGADTIVWLAASPEVAGENGKFWFDRRELPSPFHDEPAEESLWRLCESMTGRPPRGPRRRGFEGP